MTCRIIVWLFVLQIASVCLLQAQKGSRSINVTVKPFKNEKIYLVSSYGKQSISIVDSVTLDEKGEGVFRGNLVTQGIYYLFTRPSNIWAEFLMDSIQQFSVEVDTTNKETIKIRGSKENDLMSFYAASVKQFNFSIDSLKHFFKESRKSSADSLHILEALRNQGEKLRFFRDSIQRSHPGTLFSFLLNAMRLPDLPKNYFKNSSSRSDSLAAFYYIKEHFWDDVFFSDDRLIHTPFFESKLEDYFKYYVKSDIDSIWSEIEYILNFAKPGKEIFPHLLTKFTNKYMNPEFMGQDKIFIKLFEKFYLQGDSVHLNENSKTAVFERAYSLMANQIGDVAPKLILADTSQNRIDLHSLKGKYTLIVFWDPTCGHCKTELPKIDSLYKHRLKMDGVEILGVNIAYEHFKDWKKFIRDNKLNMWKHGYQTELSVKEEIRLKKPPTIRQLYDVIKTPTLYLLDEKKRIVAKHLTIEQLVNIIERK